MRKILFLPIEPKERPPRTSRETFGKRTHQFAPKIDIPGRNSLFQKSSSGAFSATPTPPSVAVEGRLPNPAIIFCNEPVPLRIILSRLNESDATVFLQSLHIELVGYTAIRAHELRRSEASAWIIMSSSDMRMPIDRPAGGGSGNTVFEFDSKLWNSRPLPNTVTPTFNTCNLTRTYFLDIKVGLSWGTGKEIFVRFQIAATSRLLTILYSLSLQSSPFVYRSKSGPASQSHRPCWTLLPDASLLDRMHSSSNLPPFPRRSLPDLSIPAHP